MIFRSNHISYNLATIPKFIAILACLNPKALGMESGKIPDSRITASSEWDSFHGASNARLNFCKYSGSWSSRYNNQNQWLQVDFQYRATITDILTQGRGNHHQWVRSYTVSFSNKGRKFKLYRRSWKIKVRYSYFRPQIGYEISPGKSSFLLKMRAPKYIRQRFGLENQSITVVTFQFFWTYTLKKIRAKTTEKH